MSLRFAAVLLSGSALFATALPAQAIEPDAAAEALAAALTGSGEAEATFESATDDGGDIVVTGLTITRSGEEADKMTFAETVIEAPTEGGDGVFDSPSITFSDGTLSGETNGSVASAVLTGVTVLEPEEGADAPEQSILFDTLEATDLSFTNTTQPGEVTVGRISMEMSNVVDNVAQDNSGTVEDITVPPELFGQAQFQPSMIGYDQMVFDLSWDGSLDPETEVLTLNDFTVGLQDGGELSITGVLGNVPSPRAMNDPDAPAQAAEMELHNVEIHWQDSSLTGRVLDLLAQQQGISREEYATQIAGAMPFLLAALNNPEFQDEVSTAVSAFLQDPQSLTITLAPDAPVTGAEISNLASTAPQSIPDRLNASITANAPE